MAIRKRGSKWYIDYYDSTGKRIVKVGGRTKKEAEMVLSELMRKKYFEKHNVQYLSEITTHELFERFREMKKKRISKRTWDDYVSYLRFWEEKHTTKKFKTLSRLDIERALQELSQSLAPKTVNGYLSALKQLYRYAEELRVIGVNPAENIKKFQEIPRKTPRFFTKDEIKAILNLCNDYYRDLFLVLLYTGLRRDELRFLEWSDVDFKNKVIKVRNKENFSTKTKKGRTIPMHPEVEKILKKRKKDNPRLVFPSPRNKYKPVKKDSWRAKLVRILKKLNIQNANLHTFRHTFASWLVMEGIDLPTVAQLMGHSDIKTTMIYSHLAPDHVKKAVEKLPKI